MERILSLKETCRLNAKATFPVLVDCVNAYFQKTSPDLSLDLIHPGIPREGLRSLMEGSDGFGLK